MDSTLIWLKLEEATIPYFKKANINKYFIDRIASDGQPTNDYKDINSHAYPLFKAGHIQSIFVATQSDSYRFKCHCLPEMKKDILYNICLTVDSIGEILGASCGCPAGAGPNGRCKHIAAFTFALEEYCSIRELRSPQSCTSELQKWNQPRKRKLESRSVNNIPFIKHEYGKTKKVALSVFYDPRPPNMRSTSQSSIQILREDLLQSGKEIVLLHLLPSSDETTSPLTCASAAASLSSSSALKLPPPPPFLRGKYAKHLESQPQPVHFTAIAEAGLALLESLKHTKEVREEIEKATREQSLSGRWFQERQLRLTSSKFGLIVKRKRQHTSLVSQLLYKSVSAKVSALQWGREHEADALNQYQQTLSDDLKVSRVGLHIDQCGYLAASPDGIVTDPNGQPIRLVEVKCPFSAQDMTVEQACCELKSFCCNLDKPHLKSDHDYYFQVQGQMAITGIHKCDFVVWTPKDVFVQNIPFDSQFWNDKCLPKLKYFFFYFVLPEIVYHKHPSSDIHDYTCYKSTMYTYY